MSRAMLGAMDIEALRRHLEETEGHIALGERHIAAQRGIIAELAHDGHDTSQAEALLATFEQTQCLHLEDRDRIRKELDDASRT